MKKIESFTIVELLVGILISSIILSLSWYVVLMISNYKTQLEEKSNYLSELARVESLISKDLFMAKRVVIVPSGIEILQSEGKVSYILDSAFIRVSETNVDTLASNKNVMLVESKEGLKLCLTDSILDYCFVINKLQSSFSQLNKGNDEAL